MSLHNLTFFVSTFLLFMFVHSSRESYSSSVPLKRELRDVPIFYCVANDFASNAQLQAAINYVCARGVNCNIIEAGGSCFNPDNLKFHASVVINAYYYAHKGQGFYCNGDGPLPSVGQLIFTDPSQGSCKFISE